MSETVLQLTVTITYNPHGTPVEELKLNLANAIDYAMNGGLAHGCLITGGLGAEILKHEVQVEDITPEPEAESEPERDPELDPDREERRLKFMSIKASGHQIAKWLTPRTPGVNFMGSAKSWMAEGYAKRHTHGRKGEPTITDKMVELMIVEFGQRELKRK